MALTRADRLRAAYQAFGAGRLDLLDELHPEFELRDHVLPETVTQRGPEAMLAQLEKVRPVFERFNIEPVELVEVGEARVVVRVRVSGLARHTGLEMERESAHLWTFRDGRPARLEIYPSWAVALEVVGR